MDAVLEPAVKVLGLAGSITTLIALAALSVLVAYLLAAQWLNSRNDVAKAAIEKGDDQALARLLGGAAIELDGISADQKFALASEELRSRARQRVILHGLLFFGFLAFLCFILALVLAPKSEKPAAATVQLDLFAALNVLRHIPPDQRQEVCPTLMAKADCERAAQMIADLAYNKPSKEQSEVIERVAARGGISEAEAKDLAACGGAFQFKVVGDALTCADGTPLPSVAVAGQGRQITAKAAIVLHASGTSAAGPSSQVANLLAKGREGLKGPLAHILVSRNGAVVQTATFDRQANHVGPGGPWHGVDVRNGNSIGIAMIHTGNYATDSYSDTQLKATEQVILALMQAYDIRIVVGHSEIARPAGRTLDPGPGIPAKIRQAVNLPAD